MSGSLNKVMLIGNLGRDPEVRKTQDGSKIVQLSVATSESWRDKNSGEKRDRTDWHRVVIFNDKLAEVAEKYLTSGSTVYIEGQLQTRKWQDQNGQDKYSTEVVLQRFRGDLRILGSRRGGASSGGHDDMGMVDGGDMDAMPSNNGGSKAAVGDDDIPF